MTQALALLLAAVPLWAAHAPRITYNKSFPGSKPAWVNIVVERSGKVLYQDEPDSEAIEFQLAEAESAELFGLAEKLEFFQRKLEADVKLPIANMGIKTFRFEDGTKKHEVKFNYTADLDGRALWDWFERITETQTHLQNLERTVRFDRLGVNQALLQLEISRDRKRLVSVAQFLPLLDRVARNDSYMNIARERAAGLAESFRALLNAKTAEPSADKPSGPQEPK